MNRFIIFDREITNSRAHINDPERVHHLLEHLGAQTGDQLKAVVPEKGLTHITLKSFNLHSGEAEFEMSNDYTLGAPRSIDLWVGLCRPPSARKIIEHGVGLPLRSVNFFRADLSDRSYLTSKVYREEFIKETVQKGLSQAGNYHDTPKIKLFTLPLQELELNPERTKYFLDMPSTQYFSHLIGPSHNRQFSLFIGPERGWSERERQWLQKSGAISVTTGQGIQRVELASFVALGQLEMLLYS